MVGLVSESFYLKYAMHSVTLQARQHHMRYCARAPRKEV